jgi:hypothetical protein
MVEKTGETPKGNQSGNTQQQSPPEETYYPITTSQPQKEATAEMQTIRLDEKSEEIEGRFQEFLKAINEETSQLAQFLVKERELTKELCSLLAQILKNLKISFSIPTECLAGLGEAAKQIRLDKNAHLTIIRNDGKVESRPLDEYSPDVVLKVLLVVTPELERMITAYRRSVSRRVTMLEKIRHELKSVQEAFASFERGGQKQP